MFARISAVLALALGAGATLQATPVVRTDLYLLGYADGQHHFRYIFNVSGIAFQQNDEFDVRFSPTLFASLSNAMPVEGFDIMLFAPNNPPGVPGDFSALALRSFGPVPISFGLDVGYTRSGLPPTGLPYSVNRYPSGPQGADHIRIESGTTGPGTPTPEPSTAVSAGAVLAIAILSRAFAAYRSSVRGVRSARLSRPWICMRRIARQT